MGATPAPFCNWPYATAPARANGGCGHTTWHPSGRCPDHVNASLPVATGDGQHNSVPSRNAPESDVFDSERLEEEVHASFGSVFADHLSGESVGPESMDRALVSFETQVADIETMRAADELCRIRDAKLGADENRAAVSGARERIIGALLNTSGAVPTHDEAEELRDEYADEYGPSNAVLGRLIDFAHHQQWLLHQVRGTDMDPAGITANRPFSDYLRDHKMRDADMLRKRLVSRENIGAVQKRMELTDAMAGTSIADADAALSALMHEDRSATTVYDPVVEPERPLAYSQVDVPADRQAYSAQIAAQPQTRVDPYPEPPVPTYQSPEGVVLDQYQRPMPQEVQDEYRRRAEAAQPQRYVQSYTPPRPSRRSAASQAWREGRNEARAKREREAAARMREQEHVAMVNMGRAARNQLPWWQKKW